MKYRRVLTFVLVAVLSPSSLLASARSFSKEEMIYVAQRIVVGMIDLEPASPPEQEPGRASMAESARRAATVTVHRTIKGSPEKTVYLLESPTNNGFDPLIVEAGTYLMFLKKRGDSWDVINGQLGLRLIEEGKIKWYDAKSLQPFWPETLVPRTQVLKEIASVVASQKK
jgi:hypothetical protein